MSLWDEIKEKTTMEKPKLSGPAVFMYSAMAVTTVAAQFIIVQRYNRPAVLRLLSRQRRKVPADVPCV